MVTRNIEMGMPRDKPHIVYKGRWLVRDVDDEGVKRCRTEDRTPAINFVYERNEVLGLNKMPT